MRWIIRLLGAVALVAVLALGVVFAVPTDRIAAVAADRLGQSLGREVTLSGEVRPTLWPHLGVRAAGLRVGNPDWAGDAPLIAAEALSVRVPWSAILAGEVQIDEITLVAPEITLVRAADGRVSWAFSDAAEPSGTAPAGPARPLTITAAEISDGALTWRDEAAGQDVRITGLEARLALPADGTARVAGAANVNGTQVTLDATAARLPALLEGGLSDLELALDWSGGELRFAGRGALAPALEGALSVEATDLGPLLAILGAAMPDLPQGFGRDRLALSGRVTLTEEGSAHLREGRVALDDTALAVALDMTPGADRPMIRGTVSGARLVLPEAQGGAAGTDTTAGWSRDRIDVSGLFAADAEIALAVERLEGAGLSVGPVDLRATLTRGRLVLDIHEVASYGGSLTGQFVVNGRGGLSVGGDLLLAGVQLQPVLRDLADYDRLQGTGSASLQFLGVGNDMATIMAGLEGEGDLSFGAGAIEGLDLAGMIRTLDPGFRGEGARTVYDQVSGNFTIAGGVLSNDDLRLDAPWGEVTGAGRVNLGAQTLDYRLTPGFMEGEAGARIRVPILVSGPWAGPSIRPDLEYLAQQELAAERERLEAEARARLEAERDRLEAEAIGRVNEALGTQFDGATTEAEAREAIEQRLRDEAEQQLRRLLGQGN